MFKRILILKDLLWAAAIGLCLLALLIGLGSSALSPYYGDRAVPQMNLRQGMEERQAARAAKKAASEKQEAEEETEEFIIYGENAEATPKLGAGA